MRFTSAIDLVNKLEPAHLQSFWYFASKVNLAIVGTFGSLLWATSDSAEEAEFYRSQLAEYRWTLRVSSKAAEFMKFTVGMLDASAVFLKDGVAKTGVSTVTKEQVAQDESAGNSGQQVDGTRPFPLQSQQTVEEMMEYVPAYLPGNEVSPSVINSHSTENAYTYEVDYAPMGMTLAPDIRPPWSDFSDNVTFSAGDVQDWSLDQLYNFETMPGVEDILRNRRIVEEYDESGNNFAGF
jgi:hypothetical protein